MIGYWRAFLGPPWEPTTSPTFWDWSTGVYPFVIPEDRTVSITLADGATTLQVQTTQEYPEAGHLWVGPNGAGEGWESIRYSGVTASTFTGLVREPAGDRVHNGVHTNGAPVRFWWPLDTNDGTLTISRELDDAWVASSWSAQIKGVRVPQAALRAKHVVVVQWRQTPAAAWANLLVGWLDGPQVRDDYRRLGEWSATIHSSHWLLSRIWASGVRVGDLDMAKHATGTASSTTLVDVDGERASGDFAAAAPDFSAERVADREPGSVWIDERLIGTPDPVAANNDPTPGLAFGLRFTGAFLNPPLGSKGGRRWIEVTATANDKGTGGLTVESASNGAANVQWVLQSGDLDAGQTLILAEDAAIFEAEHPLSAHALIQENAGFFSHLNPAGGELGLRLGALDQWWAIMRWGTGNGGLQPVGGGNDPPDWPGTAIAAPAAGETMRYVFTVAGNPSVAASYWRTDKIQHAGYRVATSPDPWIMVSLPALGLTLRDDITAVNPPNGGALELSAGVDLSTAGLPSGPGSLLIGSEQIDYTARTKTSVTGITRGQNGTPIAAHAAGDAVRVYDSTAGLFVDAHRVTSIGWKRFGGTIYPKSFRLRVSALDEPRTPDDANFAGDWVQIDAPTAHAASTYSHTLSPARRVRHLLFQFEAMTSDPARARLNEVTAVADGATFDASLTMPAGSQAHHVAHKILENAGFPAGAWIDEGDTVAVTGITTGRETAWDVLRDLGDMARMSIETQLDSRLFLPVSWYWANTSWTPTTTWTRTNAAAVEQVWAAGLPVSQVEITWRSPDFSTGGVVRYPAAADVEGDVQRMEGAVYADSASALAAATRRYWLARYPYTLLVECADGELVNAWPGSIHTVQWQIDPSQPLATRLGLVTAVEHTIEERNWSTVITLAEIERQSGA